jgi:hypothetical protein
MGIEVSRIEREYILNSVLEHEIPLRIHGFQKQSSGKLKDITEKTLVLYTADHFEKNESLRFFFSYFDHVMTFTARVEESAENLIIQLPNLILKNLQRKYDRVRCPSGTVLKFGIEDEQVHLEFPISESYNAMAAPANAELFDLSNISSLVKDFHETFSYLDNKNVKMFRAEKPSTLEEILISESGRSLFINENRFPEESEFAKIPLISTSYFERMQKNSPSLANISIQKILDSMEDLESILYCPILYHEYVVGYIFLASEQGQKKLNLSDLEWVQQFAHVLAYALEKQGYFVKQKGRREFQPEIIDISAAGILFSHDSEKLDSILQLYSDIPLTIVTEKRDVQVKSRVMRKYNDSNSIFYALQFIQLKPEDFRFLFDWIYGRKVTIEDQTMWEGGASPPPLDLD